MKSFKNGDKVRLDLTEVSGNTYAILGTFAKYARRQGFEDSEIEAVLKEAKSDDYQHLLATISSHCEA